MLRVDDRYYRIENGLAPHDLINKKGLDHGSRIRQASRLDDQVIESVPLLHKVADDADKIAAHGATNTTVVHLDNLLVSINDELSVDTHLAEFVYDNGDFYPVLRRQDAVEQGRFARTQVARDYCDRDSRCSR
jgi:hypothetical protein